MDNLDTRQSTSNARGIFDAPKTTQHVVLLMQFDLLTPPTTAPADNYLDRLVDAISMAQASAPLNASGAAAADAMQRLREEVRCTPPAFRAHILPCVEGTATTDVGIKAALEDFLRRSSSSTVQVVCDQSIYARAQKIVARSNMSRVLLVPGMWHFLNAANRAVIHAWSSFGLYAMASCLGVSHFDKLHEGTNAKATTRTIRLLAQACLSALCRLHPAEKTFAGLKTATQDHAVQHALVHLCELTCFAVALHHGIREANEELQLLAARALAAVFADLGRYPYALVSVQFLNEKRPFRLDGTGMRPGHAVAMDEGLETMGVRYLKQSAWSTQMSDDALRTHIATAQVLAAQADRAEEALGFKDRVSKGEDKDKYDGAVSQLVDRLVSVCRLTPEEALKDPLFRSATGMQNSTTRARLSGLLESGRKRLQEQYIDQLHAANPITKGRGASSLPNVVYVKEQRKTKTRSAETKLQKVQRSIASAAESLEEGNDEQARLLLNAAADAALSFPLQFAMTDGAPIRAEKGKTLQVLEKWTDVNKQDVAATVISVDLTQVVMRLLSAPDKEWIAFHMLEEKVWGACQSLIGRCTTAYIVADRPELVPPTKGFEQAARAPETADGRQQVATARMGERWTSTTTLSSTELVKNRQLRDRAIGMILASWVSSDAPRNPGGRTIIVDGPGLPHPVRLMINGQKGVETPQRHKFGEAEMSAVACLLAHPGETAIIEATDTDAIDIAVATSVRRMDADGTLKGEWFVRFRDSHNRSPRVRTFNINDIVKQVCAILPASWSCATRVLSYVCARVISGNDYKERLLPDPVKVITNYLEKAATIGPLVESAGAGLVTPVDDNISNFMNGELPYGAVSASALALAAARTAAALRYVCVLARQRRECDHTEWLEGGGFALIDPMKPLSSDNVAIVWDTRNKLVVAWPAKKGRSKRKRNND